MAQKWPPDADSANVVTPSVLPQYNRVGVINRADCGLNVEFEPDQMKTNEPLI